MSGPRGVVLAGGNGTRLGELTKVTNKHLLPVGPYPMVYYPIKKLVGAGIRDILLVSGREHVGDFVELLGSGRDHGCSLTYRVQDDAGGIAQALGLAEGFCRGDSCVVLLGDNIFEDTLDVTVFGVIVEPDQAVVVLKRVPDPHRYGVAELEAYTTLDKPSRGARRIVSIEEKPPRPKSDYAVTGIYSYPSDVFEVVRKLVPSQRGELEITDVNNHYLHAGRLSYCVMDGYWTDAGTHESLGEANRLVAQSPPRY